MIQSTWYEYHVRILDKRTGAVLKTYNTKTMGPARKSDLKIEALHRMEDAGYNRDDIKVEVLP